MLPPAEADIVRRDPDVAGLAEVRDPDVFIVALRKAALQADLRSAQIAYVQLQLLRYCHVTYRLDVAGEALDVEVRACRLGDLSTWQDTAGLKRASSRAAGI